MFLLRCVCCSFLLGKSATANECRTEFAVYVVASAIRDSTSQVVWFEELLSANVELGVVRPSDSYLFD